MAMDIKRLAAGICRDFNRWHELKDHGGNDPNWSDGDNMNLCRNHIISAKRQLIQLCEEQNENMPPEYYWPTPPEVPSGYLCPNGEYYWIRRKRLECIDRHVITKLTIKDDLEIDTLF